MAWRRPRKGKSWVQESPLPLDRWQGPGMGSRLRGNDGCARVSPVSSTGQALRGNDGCARVSPVSSTGQALRGNDGCARVSPVSSTGQALRGNDGSARVSPVSSTGQALRGNDDCARFPPYRVRGRLCAGTTVCGCKVHSNDGVMFVAIRRCGAWRIRRGRSLLGCSPRGRSRGLGRRCRRGGGGLGWRRACRGWPRR